MRKIAEKNPKAKSFIEDSLCSSKNFIRISNQGSGYGDTEYEIIIEKIQQDSTPILLSSIQSNRKYQNISENGNNIKWEFEIKDTIQDMDGFHHLIEKMETFEPDSLMTSLQYVYIDTNIPTILYGKDNSCKTSMGKNEFGHSYSFESERMYSLYNEIRAWARAHFVKVEAIPDSNKINTWSKLKDEIFCGIVVSENIFKMDSTRSFKIQKGTRQLDFDFSPFKENEEIFCKSNLGFIGSFPAKKQTGQ